MEQKALQVGAVVLVLALLLRLAGGRGDITREAGATLLFLSSGRMVTQTLPPQESTEAAEPEQPAQEASVPVFGQAQTELVQVNSSWEVDTLALLQAPLQWDLQSNEPAVLILHTHATESYENTESYTESSAYRTLDERYNMVSIGDEVAQILENAGIKVIHDRTLHDYPSYNDAYSLARESIRAQLEQNPSICLVLDLHRDAAEDASGNQVERTATVEGSSCAQLMMVMGSDMGSLSHTQWQKNLSLAVKLQAQLESQYPGLCRPIKLSASRYNQDLSAGALLVEVGSAGNTRHEALQAAKYLAEGIIALANGANI